MYVCMCARAHAHTREIKFHPKLVFFPFALIVRSVIIQAETDHSKFINIINELSSGIVINSFMTNMILFIFNVFHFVFKVRNKLTGNRVTLSSMPHRLFAEANSIVLQKMFFYNCHSQAPR